MSTIELSNEFGLRQKTCRDFKWKLQQVVKSCQQYPLKGEIHVDEFYIGGAEEQKRGRSKEVSCFSFRKSYRWGGSCICSTN
jgi:hypothetical protein